MLVAADNEEAKKYEESRLAQMGYKQASHMTASAFDLYLGVRQPRACAGATQRLSVVHERRGHCFLDERAAFHYRCSDSARGQLAGSVGSLD